MENSKNRRKKQTREEALFVKLSASEKEAIERASFDMGLSMSAWARRILLAELSAQDYI